MNDFKIDLSVQFEPTDDLAERRSRLLDAVTARHLDSVIVVGRAFYDRPGPLAYYSGHFPPFPASPFSGTIRGLGHSFLIISHRGPPILLVDSAWREDDVSIDDVRRSTDLVHSLRSALSERSLHDSRIGVVGMDLLPVAFERELLIYCPRLQLVDCDDISQRQRMRKSPREQEGLRLAARVAHAALAAAIEAVAAGQRERDICAIGLEAATRAGADFVRYFRVHTGSWSAIASRWPPATDQKIEPGDLVMLDIIGAVNGYQFDVLRTVAVPPVPPAKREILHAVESALNCAVQTAKVGTTAGAVAEAAVEMLNDFGFLDTASRFVGHGIGLETVEFPYVVPGDATPLAAGMCLCLEPAIWIPGQYGASMEQEVLVHSASTELLTQVPLFKS